MNIHPFLGNPSKNEQYEQFREYLDTYRQQIGAMYVYTIATEDEDVQIIVDGLNSADAADIGTSTTALTYERVEAAFQVVKQSHFRQTSRVSAIMGAREVFLCNNSLVN
ncbi:MULTISPECIES: hypothetical protein [unclassified Exiguobacterium]|uniref:hypothetical protein n=1 Tax=unclassified Exiguobacterium TaxID=2644629 RepID=UPI001BE8538C|nr:MULTISPECIES: hypothetical protein [unclassified Exiguobacterium]